MQIFCVKVKFQSSPKMGMIFYTVGDILKEILDWLKLAEKFADDGDAQSMLGAAEEILEIDKNCAEGYAVKAEANLYLGEIAKAENFLQKTFALDKNNLRGRLIAGGIAAEKFNLIDEFKIFDAVINQARKIDDNFFAQKILFKALCWSVNGLYLAGNTKAAAENLYEASTLTSDNERAAELYSKHLFFRNYFETDTNVIKTFAQGYNKFFANVQHYAPKNYAHDKIKIGCISPDFRKHAVANFVSPLLNDFDEEKFSVTCYNTGKSDFVTQKLRNKKILWYDLYNVDAAEIAKIIYADEIDILVDLSGHSQNSCLPILVYKPAPVQITALGYTATTGLNAVDYFLSDTICAADNFNEKILTLAGCQFCFSPIQKFPAVKHKRNKFVIFGSFNNVAKVNDKVLICWKEILDALPNSKIIIKNKICSVDDGKKILFDRLQKINFPVEKVELRPYSKDYLAQYNEIDIALDTFPYNGGLTTCEALYMGVPVVTLQGNFHGSKIGASILTAANLSELIAQDSNDYIKKAVELANGNFSNYHKNLREKVSKSALMNAKNYMLALEKIYCEIIKNFDTRKKNA